MAVMDALLDFYPHVKSFHFLDTTDTDDVREDMWLLEAVLGS